MILGIPKWLGGKISAWESQTWEFPDKHRDHVLGDSRVENDRSGIFRVFIEAEV